MWSVGKILTGFIFLGFILGCQAKNEEVSDGVVHKAASIEKEEPNVSALSEAVLNKDLTATHIAKQMGPAAIGELQTLCKNEDPEVRLIAVIALGEINHPIAVETLLTMVNDDSAAVAAAAVDQLERNEANVGFEKLMKAAQSATDPAIRRRLVLSAGRVGQATDVPSLKDWCAKQTSNAVKGGCIAALARQGDPESQQAFVNYLLSTSDGERLDALQLAEYIGQPWLLQPLGSLLGDKEEIQHLGVDDIPGVPSYLRTCDIAVKLIAQISQAHFSFPVDRHANFTDSQLNEVRQQLEMWRR